MPTSEASNITPIMNEVCRVRPQSVLDLGAGFGKYGVLCREYLDIAQERIAPETWKALIVGVEGFEGYYNTLHSHIYTSTFAEDFSDVSHWHKYKAFDLVLLIDSLEHLERALGERLLAHLLRFNKRVIVSVPDGDYPQGAVNGNSLECHRSRWTFRDFVENPAHSFGAPKMRMLHKGICTVVSLGGQYGS